MYTRTPITDEEIAAAKRTDNARRAAPTSRFKLHPEVNPSMPVALQRVASRNLFARDAAEQRAGRQSQWAGDTQVPSSTGRPYSESDKPSRGPSKQEPPAADFHDTYNDFSARYNERLAASANALVSTPPVRTAQGGGAASKQGPEDPFDKFVNTVAQQRTSPTAATDLANQQTPQEHQAATILSHKMATVTANDDGSYTTNFPSGGTATSHSMPAGYMRQQLQGATTDSVGRPLPFTQGTDLPKEAPARRDSQNLRPLGKDLVDAASDIRDRNTDIKSLIDNGDFAPKPPPSPTPKPEDNPKVTDLFKQRGYIT